MYNQFLRRRGERVLELLHLQHIFYNFQLSAKKYYAHLTLKVRVSLCFFFPQDFRVFQDPTLLTLKGSSFRLHEEMDHLLPSPRNSMT